MTNYEADLPDQNASDIVAPFVNNAQVNAEYFVNDQQRQISGSDQVIVNLVSANLTKQSSVAVAQHGDIVEYVITFKNNGSLLLGDVKIADSLPAELSLVEGSIVPAPQPGETLQTGVTVGGTATLSFKATVNTTTASSVVNTASSNFVFRDAREGDVNGESNPATNTIALLSPGLDVIKLADRTYVTASGDEVVYTIVATNTGTVELRNIVVTDVPPAGMRYKANSTIKNGGAPTDENPANGINIGKLLPEESFEVKFTFVVI